MVAQLVMDMQVRFLYVHINSFLPIYGLSHFFQEMDEHMRSMLHHRELENLKGRYDYDNDHFIFLHFSTTAIFFIIIPVQLKCALHF